MSKRMLDCCASDFEKFSKEDLIESIKKSEGRVLACETIGNLQPMLINISNAEFVSAMGADLVILNMFDVLNPHINGIEVENKEDTIKRLKELIGRPVAINLEPVDENKEGQTDEIWKMTSGRRATLQNAIKAYQMGVNMIVLTGNPGMGVSNKAIEDTLKIYKEALGDKIVLCAGKMHASGVLNEAGQNIITKQDIKGFVEAGADIILLPSPGTVSGITMEYIRELISYAHELGVLTLCAIGTSQEGADTETIKRIALMTKMAGADIHHLGDTGYAGMALPENIFAYSVAVRGVRHTYRRMAMSIRR